VALGSDIIRYSSAWAYAVELWSAAKDGRPELRDQALAEFARLAEDGDPHAQDTLADMYFNGDGVPKDLELSRYWRDRLAALGERGNVAAQMLLHWNYLMGPIVRDWDIAAYWLLKAAEAGDPEAQYEIWCNAEIVFPGDAGEAKRKAAPWLEKAAAQEYAEAMFVLSRRFGSPDNPTPKWRELITKAADQGLPAAIGMLRKAKPR